VEKYDCNGGGYVLRVTAEDQLLFATLDDCNNFSLVTSASSLQSNTWYHVAGLWNGSELRVYINGVLDGAASASRNPKAGTSPLRIGQRGNSGTPFAGVIDEVRLWNVARTEVQLVANKDGCLSGTESGLAGYWRFDEGSGTVANDATSNNNDGLLLNGPIWVPSPLGCAGPPGTNEIRTLTVNSENPNAGVAIEVTPNDRNGEGNGTTQFTRQYSNSPNVTLTAPLTAANSNSFVRWKLDGVDQTPGQRTLNLSLDTNRTASAIYTPTPSGSGQALLYDGLNDFVQIPDSASVRITNFITVEAWIKRAVRGAQHSIVEKYDCNGGGYVLRVTPEDLLLFATLDDCGDFSLVTGATSLQSNTWYHVAGLWDGSELRVYVNGVLDGAASASRNPKAGTSPLRIGQRGNDGTFFAGVIDEVRLWNVARTEPQLAANKDGCLSGTESGLAGYWRFDEGNGTVANDATTNNNDGQLINGPIWVPSPLACAGPPGTNEIRTLTVSSENPNAGVAIEVTPHDRNGEGNGTTQFTRQYTNSTTVTLLAPLTAVNSNSFVRWKVDGVDQSLGQRALIVNLNTNRTARAIYEGTPSGSGQALLYDGVNDFVQIPDSTSVRITNFITVEAWIKRAVRGAQHSIVEKYDCTGGGYVLRVTSEDQLLFATLDNCGEFSLVTGATILQSNTWYHVAGLWNGSELRVYVNGTLDGAASSSRNPKTGTSPLRIGQRGNDGTFFAGVIDEVRLWNVARSEAQLAANKDGCLSGTESGLAGYWRFNEGTGLLVHDSSTNGNQGLLDSPVWVSSPLLCNGTSPQPIVAPRLLAREAPMRLTISKDAKGQACRIIVTSPPGTVSILESSTDFYTWTPLLLLTNSTGTTQLIEPKPQPRAVPNRFFRLRLSD
jgi:hypothetical protein